MDKNLEDVKDFVNAMGRWQSPECYETKVWIDKNYIIIANFYNYVAEEEKEKCHDTVVLLGNKEMTYAKVLSIEPGEIDKNKLMKYNWLFDIQNYLHYCIKISDEKKADQLTLF